MDELTWKPLIGQIDDSIPNFILMQICQSYGLGIQDLLSNKEYKKKVISIINLYKPVTINLKKPDWSIIASFINSKEEWNIQKLYIAYNNYLRFKKELIIDKEKILDIPTNKHPESIGDIFLYSFCRRENVIIPSFILQDQFKQQVTKYLSLSEKEIINSIIHNITIKLEKSNKSYLFNMLSEIQEIPTLSYNEIKKIGENYRRKYTSKKEFNKISPKTPEEFVVKAALVNEKDITNEDDFEYALIAKSGINLRKRFNPNLPNCLYSTSQLRNLCINQGYSINIIDNSKLYTLLNDSYINDTFYIEKFTSINKDNILGDKISNISYLSLIYYGNRPLDNTEMYSFSFGELLALFEKYNKFTNPYGKYFPRLAINKLLLISGQNIWEDETQTEFNIRNKLVECIENIIEIQDNYSQMEIKLLENKKYWNVYKELLTMIMELGMNIRGWVEGIKYPIKKHFPTNPEELAIILTEKFANLDKVFKRYPIQSSVTLDLPLVQRANKIYIVERNKEIGTSIGQKIEIMKREDNDKNEFACIRTSSNYLIASCYRYLTYINCKPDFKIDDLRSIY